MPNASNLSLTSPTARFDWVRILTLGIVALIAVWNLSAAVMVNVEYGDGYATIVNAQYFLGLSDGYYAQRPPLLSWLLMPAEWLATRLGLHPFDVRLHHLSQAIFNAVYLFGVYAVLRRYAADSRLLLMAFLATIPSYIFFSYAPYLNTDIVPGLIFLGMLLIAHRFALRPSWWAWLALILLGTCAALIKQTFALFWLILVLIWGFLLLRRGKVKRAMLLVAGALISGALAWFAMAFTLVGWGDPEQSLLWYPLEQIRIVYLFNQRTVDSGAWAWWYYFYNSVSAYGGACLILSVAGVVFAFYSRNLLYRTVAVAWLLGIGFMLLVPYKEMRYLAFLAPLSAFLALGVLQWIQTLRRQRLWFLLIGVILALDLGRGALEALRVYDAYFREDQVVRFLQVIDDKAEPEKPILMAQPLSFVSDPYTAIPGDRYHRLAHVSAGMIGNLYAPGGRVRVTEMSYPIMDKLKGDYADQGVSLRQGVFQSIHATKDLEHPEIFPQETIVLWATNLVLRSSDTREKRLERGQHYQFAAYSQPVVYERRGDRYVAAEEDVDERPFAVIRPGTNANEQLFLPVAPQLQEGDLAALGYAADERVEIWGYRLTAYCELQCVYY